MENRTFSFDDIFFNDSYIGIVNPDEPIPVGVFSDLYSEECGDLTADYLVQVKACNFWSGVLIIVFGIFALFCNMISIHVFMR